MPDWPFLERAGGLRGPFQHVLTGAEAWTPAELFGASDDGAWFDPNTSTAFTDDARTTPSGATDPIGGLTDLSGKGNHGAQATAGERPTLQVSGGLSYLLGDGVDDWMPVDSTSGILGTQWTVVISGRFLAGSGLQLFTTAANFRSSPRYIVADTDVRWYNSGGSAVDLITGVSAGTDYVFTFVRNGNTSVVGYKNGAIDQTVVPFDDTGASNQGFALLSSNTTTSGGPATFRMYHCTAINRILTAEERGQAEAYAATLAGVTL